MRIGGENKVEEYFVLEEGNIVEDKLGWKEGDSGRDYYTFQPKPIDIF